LARPGPQVIRETRATMTFVHTLPVRAPQNISSMGPLQNLRDCDSSESVLNILINEIGFLRLGADLPDRSRIFDAFMLHRLAIGAIHHYYLPISRIKASLSDPNIFVFCRDLETRRIR
jgi:hypothetical protein